MFQRELEAEEKDLDLMITGEKAGLVTPGNTEEAPKQDTNTQPQGGSQNVTGGEDWKAKYEEAKHKYDVLSGKQYREVPRLHAENKALKERIRDLEKLQESHMTSKRESEKANVDEVYKTLEDEIGQQAASSIRKILDNNNASRIDDLSGKLAKVEEGISRARANSFTENLTALVPDWVEINTDEEWLDWLGGRIHGSRMTYQDALDSAASEGDFKVVAEIFNTFKKKSKSQKPSQSELLEPKQAGSSPSKSDSNKKIYTKREIDTIYKKLGSGVYSEKESARIESEIDLAYVEGRITD